MTTFIGDYPCRIDAKGRVVLPATFKKQMSQDARDRFVVKKDIFEKSLVLYPMDEWERQVALLRKKINPYNREHNKLLDAFYRGTAELLLDTSNRLLIPKRLLDKAGIKKEVILAGQDDRIKLWDKQVYEGREQDEDDFALLAEKILGGPVNDDD
ncbi:MAG: division/cell wall cluster transcriptional repressor MraZ [Bacteroidetes bacterium]|nr:division/cell wall cluster transcriptional repressor MraZ [Bacteroidota bacterium]